MRTKAQRPTHTLPSVVWISFVLFFKLAGKPKLAALVTKSAKQEAAKTLCWLQPWTLGGRPDVARNRQGQIDNFMLAARRMATRLCIVILRWFLRCNLETGEISKNSFWGATVSTMPGHHLFDFTAQEAADMHTGKMAEQAEYETVFKAALPETCILCVWNRASKMLGFSDLFWQTQVVRFPLLLLARRVLETHFIVLKRKSGKFGKIIIKTYLKNVATGFKFLGTKVAKSRYWYFWMILKYDQIC